MNRKVSPRIDIGAHEYYRQSFSSPHAGVEYVLEAWPLLYREVLSNVRGAFKRNELHLILQACNDMDLDPNIAGHRLSLAVADYIRLDQGAEQWQLDDPGGFLERIMALPRMDRACLEIWGRAFWESGAHLKGEDAPNAWVAQLLRD